jgi:putative membrane protein
MNANSRIFELAMRWLLLAAAVWVAAELIEGIQLEGLKSTLIVAAILGLLNLYLKPALTLFTLPITIVTLGLFIVVINAALLLLTDWLAEEIGGISFEVEDLGAALLGAIVISIVGMLLDSLIKPARIRLI